MIDIPHQTTGNMLLALPRITAPPGGLDRLAFLMMAHRGLVEISADAARSTPLICADVSVGGTSLLSQSHGSLIADWIPFYSCDHGPVRARVTWLTPSRPNGLALRIEAHNTGDTAQDVCCTFRLCWGHTTVQIYDADPLDGRLSLDPNGWGGGVSLGWVATRTQFAVGIGTDDNESMHLDVRHADSGESLWQGDPTHGAVRRFAPGAIAELGCTKQQLISPGERITLDVFIGVGQDHKSAPLHGRHLRELGFDTLLAESVNDLNRLNASLPQALANETALSGLTRRNRIFCYYFSLGRTLDTEELCPVTSRSSDYYVSAAYWDRDSLLWSFPTILDMDRAMAAEMLEVAFGRQGRNIGQHSRFIDGCVCEPGFELDELCAPIIALDAYLRVTDDWSIVERIELDRRSQQIERLLESVRHPQIALFGTEYLPTDDPPAHKYCIYDNVLVWLLCSTMRRLAEYRDDGAGAARWAALREQVHDAIWEYGVTSASGEKLFAWSTDLAGNYRLYDEPPGSLTLLAWYGFCSYDDPIYQATVRWIYSAANPHYFAQADEIGCQHEQHPWVLAVANSLLIPQRKDAALALLKRASMDDGLACEAIHEDTGRVVSGKHFATCAGFLCHALVTAFQRSESGRITSFATATRLPKQPVR